MAERDSRTQHLVDRNEVADVISRLALTLDEQRMDDLRSVVADDVVTDFGTEVFEGVDTLAEHGRQSHAAFERTQHVITNLLITLDGDRAAVRANLHAVGVRHADEPTAHVAFGGYYRFELIRSANGWRISRLELHSVWTSGDAGVVPA